MTPNERYTTHKQANTQLRRTRRPMMPYREAGSNQCKRLDRNLTHLRQLCGLQLHILLCGRHKPCQHRRSLAWLWELGMSTQHLLVLPSLAHRWAVARFGKAESVNLGRRLVLYCCASLLQDESYVTKVCPCCSCRVNEELVNLIAILHTCILNST